MLSKVAPVRYSLITTNFLSSRIREDGVPVNGRKVARVFARATMTTRHCEDSCREMPVCPSARTSYTYIRDVSVNEVDHYLLT